MTKKKEKDDAKVLGELWCKCQGHKISRTPLLKTVPTGGTTDYAVEVFNEIMPRGNIRSMREDTRLPMMMMDDAILCHAYVDGGSESRMSQWSRVQCQRIDILRNRVGYHDYSKKPGVE